jgi:hypothetical protein
MSFSARPESKGIDESLLLQTSQTCRACHPRHDQNWLAGGHSLSYQDFLLDEKHNSTELLNEDCFRCHGMFFEEGIRDAVQPISTEGPWQLKQPAMAAHHAIHCSVCHRIHAEGDPHAPPRQTGRGAVGTPRPRYLGDVCFYSRNEQKWFADEDLPLPQMVHQGRTVDVSSDPRQRLCVQCHAPNAFHEVGSSDDRTPVGVHEGISCMACHRTHDTSARASCAACHPRLSNCGLDVTRMDTSFADPDSKHDIHFVGCRDCHPDRNDRGSREE